MTSSSSRFTSCRRVLLLALCSLGLFGAFHTGAARPATAYDWCSKGCHKHSKGTATLFTAVVAVQDGFAAS